MIYHLDRNADKTVLDQEAKAGDRFVRYYFDDLYAKGQVSEINMDFVTVDFGDTIRRFPRAACAMVFNASNLSHLMTTHEGEIVRDFRDPGSPSCEDWYSDFTG